MTRKICLDDIDVAVSRSFEVMYGLLDQHSKDTDSEVARVRLILIKNELKTEQDKVLSELRDLHR
jgi:hypothetical protein